MLLFLGGGEGIKRPSVKTARPKFRQCTRASTDKEKCVLWRSYRFRRDFDRKFLLYQGEIKNGGDSRFLHV